MPLLLFPVIALSQSPCINNTNSLSFASSSANINTDNNLAPDTAITVEAWIRATSWAVNVFDGTIACKHSWSQGEQGYVLRAGASGQVDFKIATNISWQGPTSPAGLMSTNTWYHVAGTYDGDSVKVFINGVQQGALYMPTGMIPGTAYPWRIGRLSDQAQAQTRYWNGQIDEVRIWNRALTAAEIYARHDHHLDPAQETGLIGYWRFNEGSGTTITDQTVNGNNGTLAGATWSTLVPFNQTAATPIIIPFAFNLTSSITAVSYQWNLNGVPIAGATGQSWTAVANGSYTVTITDTAGCTATSGPYIIASVGLQEIQSSEIVVGRDYRHFNFSLRDGDVIESIGIYNANGQRILFSQTKANHFEWDASLLPAGIYQLSIETASGRFGTTRLPVP